MAAEPKQIQFETFVNEKIEIEAKLHKESEESAKRQLRLLHHQAHEATRRLDRQEEMIRALTDYILEK